VSVKSEYLKHPKHRLVEFRYSAYDYFGEVAPVAALVSGAQMNCVTI